MNQHESSGSDDDGSDNEDADKLLAAAVLEAEMEDAPVLDPETLRQQEIIAEVARRRAERDNNTTATKQKSDEIFDRFDVDKDGYMNYEELRTLARPRAATCRMQPIWLSAKR